MMTFKFSPRSLRNLEGVHPDLALVLTGTLAVSKVDFVVIEGRRSMERQKELFASGASRTLNSRHLYGLAIDYAAWSNGALTFDEKLLQEIAYAVKIVAMHRKIPIVYGGDFPLIYGGDFVDGDHIELDRTWYPDKTEPLVA